MNYSFPKIAHIDDVLPHIDGDCFRVIPKDCGHTYINYVKMGSETFPPFVGDKISDHKSAIRRECRGIAFDTHTGLITSRPFHKFFNFGEREEVDSSNVDFTEKHWTNDKLDGSMIRPIMVGPNREFMRWGTKMGITEVGLFAEFFVAKSLVDYTGFCTNVRADNATPLFEYVGPHNKIVVDYEENMVLLAIRHNVTGEYLTPEQCKTRAETWDVPFAEIYDPVTDPDTFFRRVKENTDFGEGIVIQFETGHRVKVKTDTYVTLHRIKETSRTERTLVLGIFDEVIDDLLPLVSPEERKEINLYVKSLWKAINTLGEDLDKLHQQVRNTFETKKDFALAPENGRQSMSKLESSAVFSLWDGKVPDGNTLAENLVLQALSSETKWKEFKITVNLSKNLRKFETTWNDKHEME